MWAPIIAAGASLLGGLLGSRQQSQNINATNAANMAINQQNIAFQQEANAQNQALAREINAANLEGASSINQANIQASALANELTLADKARDRELQREFAQSGITWRMQDALRAGIHPIYALGGAGAAYSPSAISLDVPRSVAATQTAGAPAVAPQMAMRGYAPGVGSHMSAMGQDISRAIMATATASARDEAFEQTSRDLQLQNFTLRNELLSSQIAKLKAGQNPAMPSNVDVPEAGKPEERPILHIGAGKINTDPRTSNADDFEKRYGEMSDWIFGPYIAWRDYQYNTGGVLEHLKTIARQEAVKMRSLQNMRRYQAPDLHRWRGHF